MPTPSAHYDYGQLEGLWISQGGPSRLAPLMAAIAMAESGGNAQARNASGASGLWQILGKPFPGDPFNPETNARMAVAKWKSQGLGAWVTYTSGAYKRFFRRGVPPQAPPGAAPGIPYGNPLRRVANLQPGRIDQGVDYSGTGPVYALGPGVITYAGVGNTGWGPPAGVAPGGYIKERLTEGPLKGRYVYFAEGVRPTVRVGQRVTSATQIGVMSAPIETGFAQPSGTAALAASQFSGSNPTAYGVAYSKLLTEVGAPAGVGPTAGGTGSASPGWPPPWLTGILSGVDKFFGGTGAAGAGAAGGGGLFGIAGAIANVASTLSGLATAIDWLFHPENWVRIIAGVGGGVLVISGIGVLSHVGAEVPIPGVGGSVSARPAALPVGILMVGGGGVLLFVAFHNLPSTPTNIGEVLGSLRDQAQAAAGPQPAGLQQVAG